MTKNDKVLLKIGALVALFIFNGVTQSADNAIISFTQTVTSILIIVILVTLVIDAVRFFVERKNKQQ